MNALRRFLTSSLGQKTLMALTGLGLVGFLVAHLAGNLTLFQGAEALNEYEHKLESFGPLLYVAEAGLGLLFVVHIGLALRVTARNREARGVGYRQRTHMGESTVASRSMLISGLVLLLFLLVHLIDFRVPKAMGSDSVEDMGVAVIDRLTSPIGFLIYMVGLTAMGLHLRHAFASAFQTLGVSHPRYSLWLRNAGFGLAVVLFVGFASIPIYLMFQS
tara:strand:- start:9910 stop:10563 length:654 start_codon:yes stop_codon:yes gene_type:complete